MTTPGIARYRRTFHTPLWVGMVLTAIVLGLFFLVLHWTATGATVVLVPVEAGDPVQEAATLQRLAARVGAANHFDAVLAEGGAIERIAKAIGAADAERHEVDTSSLRWVEHRLRWRLRGDTVLVALPAPAIARLLSDLADDERAAAAASAADGRYWVVTLTGFGPPAALELRD
jgi:hypothetical protein